MSRASRSGRTFWTAEQAHVARRRATNANDAIRAAPRGEPSPLREAIDASRRRESGMATRNLDSVLSGKVVGQRREARSRVERQLFFMALVSQFHVARGHHSPRTTGRASRRARTFLDRRDHGCQHRFYDRLSFRRRAGGKVAFGDSDPEALRSVGGGGSDHRSRSDLDRSRPSAPSGNDHRLRDDGAANTHGRLDGTEMLQHLFRDNPADDFVIHGQKIARRRPGCGWGMTTAE